MSSNRYVKIMVHRLSSEGSRSMMMARDDLMMAARLSAMTAAFRDFLTSAAREKPHNRRQGIDTPGPYGRDHEEENRFA
jgi:hypothetical protein